MREKFLYSDVFLATSTDELRPAMGHVFFKDGYLYATDSHIAVKQSLKIHDLNDEEIAMLDGKMLHREALKAMKRYRIFEVQPDGVSCRGKAGEMVLFKFATEHDIGKYPNVNAVISLENGSLSRIGINASLLDRLQKCLVRNASEGLKLTFGRSESSAIIVTTSYYSREDQLSLIMPFMINDEGR